MSELTKLGNLLPGKVRLVLYLLGALLTVLLGSGLIGPTSPAGVALGGLVTILGGLLGREFREYRERKKGG